MDDGWKSIPHGILCVPKRRSHSGGLHWRSKGDNQAVFQRADLDGAAAPRPIPEPHQCWVVCHCEIFLGIGQSLLRSRPLGGRLCRATDEVGSRLAESVAALLGSAELFLAAAGSEGTPGGPRPKAFAVNGQVAPRVQR